MLPTVALGAHAHSERNCHPTRFTLALVSSLSAQSLALVCSNNSTASNNKKAIRLSFLLHLLKLYLLVQLLRAHSSLYLCIQIGSDPSAEPRGDQIELPFNLLLLL